MVIPMRYSSAIAALLLGCQTAGAAELWDNGDANQAGSLGDSQVHTFIADDFYVPGAGWYVSGAETRGFFLSNNHEVDEVEVTLYPHHNDTGKPDTDAPIDLEVLSFEAEPTGQVVHGYEEVIVSVELPRTYLKGQRYFWIGFNVFNQHGQTGFHFRASEDNFNQPAHIMGNSSAYPYGGDLDMVYSLSGDRIEVAIAGLPDKLQIAKPSTESGTVSLYLGADAKRVNGNLRSGLYTLGTEGDRPRLFRVDRYGPSKVEFEAGSSDGRQMLHSPLGDDMCGKAEGSIQEFCQSFVACAAYDFGCN